MPTPTVDQLVTQAQQIVTDLTAFKTANDAALAAKDQQIADLTAKIAAARTAAQADKDADDAKESGQGVLDALA